MVRNRCIGRVHGSSVFTRGETQSLTSLTLGTSLDAQSVDGVLDQREDKFMLHYNFPFSTGEARPIRVQVDVKFDMVT